MWAQLDSKLLKRREVRECDFGGGLVQSCQINMGPNLFCSSFLYKKPYPLSCEMVRSALQSFNNKLSCKI